MIRTSTYTQHSLTDEANSCFDDDDLHDDDDVIAVIVVVDGLVGGVGDFVVDLVWVIIVGLGIDDVMTVILFFWYFSHYFSFLCNFCCGCL